MSSWVSGSLLKTERADKHIRDLNRLQRRFFDGDSYETFTEYDPKTRRLVYRVRINCPIPRYWGVVIGDVLHNLHSALDLLACQAVRKGHGKVTQNTYFPIRDTKEKFEAALCNGKIKGAPPITYQVVRSFKPYKRGNRLLWWLHALNIKDKHLLIVPVGISHAYEGMQHVTTQGLEPVKFIWMVPEPPRVFPIKNGSIVKETMQPRYKKVYNEYKFPFEIAFNERTAVRGEPVIGTLNAMSDLVKAIIKDFDSLVFI